MGNRYELTPLAEQLAELTTSALAAVARVFASDPDFDPATAEREFTVLVSDYAISVLGPGLAALLPRRRTSGSVCTRSPPPRSTRPVRLSATSTRWCSRTGTCRTCLHSSCSPTGGSASSPTGHPGIGEKLTMTDLEELPMVVAHQPPASYTPAGKQLSMLGVQPRVQLVAETFLALPFLVAAGNGVALIQERLARQLAPAVPVRILPLPL